MSIGQYVFQLINPMIMGIISLGFFTAYFYQRKIESALWLGLAYLCGAIAFSLNFYRHLFDYVAISLVINSLFIFTACLLIKALCVRKQNKCPKKTLALVVLTTISGLRA